MSSVITREARGASRTRPPRRTALGLLWFVVLALLLRSELVASAYRTLLAGRLLLFLCWSGLSVLWSSSMTLTVLDTQKLLVYVGLVLAALLVVERRRCRSS